MVTLILTILVGGLFTYLAQDNLTPVTLRLGTYIFTDIPLFYILIGALLIGLILAYLIQIINSIFIAFSIHGKNTKIKQAKTEIAELTKRIHQLEIENEKLKTKTSDLVLGDPNAL